MAADFAAGVEPRQLKPSPNHQLQSQVNGSTIDVRICPACQRSLCAALSSCRGACSWLRSKGHLASVVMRHVN